MSDPGKLNNEQKQAVLLLFPSIFESTMKEVERIRDLCVKNSPNAPEGAFDAVSAIVVGAAQRAFATRLMGAVGVVSAIPVERVAAICKLADAEANEVISAVMTDYLLLNMKGDKQ